MKRMHPLTFVFLLILCPYVSADTSDKIENISSGDVILGNMNSIILDVRTPAEFQSGHIQGAININIKDSNFRDQIANLDPSKTYVVHCAANVSNGRSQKAINMMLEAGFDRVFSLDGGIIAWKEEGREIVINESK
ncbi:MAG: rhodanese-like domain-containing protein [Pseudomonadota bacterium]